MFGLLGGHHPPQTLVPARSVAKPGHLDVGWPARVWGADQTKRSPLGVANTMRGGREQKVRAVSAVPAVPRSESFAPAAEQLVDHWQELDVRPGWRAEIIGRRGRAEACCRIGGTDAPRGLGAGRFRSAGRSSGFWSCRPVRESAFVPVSSTTGLRGEKLLIGRLRPEVLLAVENTFPSSVDGDRESKRAPGRKREHRCARWRTGAVGTGRALRSGARAAVRTRQVARALPRRRSKHRSSPGWTPRSSEAVELLPGEGSSAVARRISREAPGLRAPRKSGRLRSPRRRRRGRRPRWGPSSGPARPSCCA